MLSKVLRVYSTGHRKNDFSGAKNFYDIWVIDEPTERERRSSSSYFHQEEAEQEMNKLLTILDGQPSRLDGKYSKSMNKGECAHYYYRKGTFYDFLQKSDALGRENHAPKKKAEIFSSSNSLILASGSDSRGGDQIHSNFSCMRA